MTVSCTSWSPRTAPDRAVVLPGPTLSSCLAVRKAHPEWSSSILRSRSPQSCAGIQPLLSRILPRRGIKASAETFKSCPKSPLPLSFFPRCIVYFSFIWVTGRRIPRREWKHEAKQNGELPGSEILSLLLSFGCAQHSNVAGTHR